MTIPADPEARVIISDEPPRGMGSPWKCSCGNVNTTNFARIAAHHSRKKRNKNKEKDFAGMGRGDCGRRKILSTLWQWNSVIQNEGFAFCKRGVFGGRCNPRTRPPCRKRGSKAVSSQSIQRW